MKFLSFLEDVWFFVADSFCSSFFFFLSCITTKLRGSNFGEKESQFKNDFHLHHKRERKIIKKLKRKIGKEKTFFFELEKKKLLSNVASAAQTFSYLSFTSPLTRFA